MAGQKTFFIGKEFRKVSSTFATVPVHFVIADAIVAMEGNATTEWTPAAAQPNCAGR